MDAMLAVSQSQKGTKILVVNGYMFTLKYKAVDDNEYWRCTTRSCKAKFTLENDKIINENSIHTHDCDPNDIRKRAIKKEIKELAIKTRETPQAITHRCQSKVKSSEASTLPLVNSLKRGIRRVRQRTRTKKTH